MPAATSRWRLCSLSSSSWLLSSPGAPQASVWWALCLAKLWERGCRHLDFRDALESCGQKTTANVGPPQGSLNRVMLSGAMGGMAVPKTPDC